MTPIKAILSEASRQRDVVDETGRRLRLRTLTALDTLRLLKAAGPTLAQNQPWLSMAMLAVAVTEIDGVPVPAPVNEQQIEAMVDRLGDAGLTAVAAAEDDDAASDPVAVAGNSRGTPA